MLFEDDDPDSDALVLARRIWRRRILGALPFGVAADVLLFQGWQSRVFGKGSGLLLVPLALGVLVSLALLAGLVAPPTHSTKRLAIQLRDGRRAGRPLRARSWSWVLLMAVAAAAGATGLGIAMRVLQPWAARLAGS